MDDAKPAKLGRCARGPPPVAPMGIRSYEPGPTSAGVTLGKEGNEQDSIHGYKKVNKEIL